MLKQMRYAQLDNYLKSAWSYCPPVTSGLNPSSAAGRSMKMEIKNFTAAL